MTRLFPEQLAAQLREGLRACYLLIGNDPLLLQESQDSIRQAAQAQQFIEHHSFIVDAQSDWPAIFSICQALSLFASRQTLTLTLPENGPNAAINEQLQKLTQLLHADLLLIVRCQKLSKAQENSSWIKAISEQTVWINCQTPESQQLPNWLTKRAQRLSLTIDKPANQLLCYCYEGNLLALAQALERLSLLYPDGKLTLPRVEQAVYDAAYFTPYQWIDALLAGKNRRAWHILHQFQCQDSEVVILLRTLQRELLLLLTLQRQLVGNKATLRTLFDQHKIWQNRRNLLTQALQRLSLATLTQGIEQLCRIEVILKQDYGQSVWRELEQLTMMLCGTPLLNGFSDNENLD
jgi:DNA polymerase-3 subunit delta